jgi:RNA polymerase primary sigma factor
MPLKSQQLLSEHKPRENMAKTINEKLLADGAIEYWQFLLRENLPFDKKTLESCPNCIQEWKIKKRKTKKNLLNEEKWTWEILEQIENGAVTQTLLPYEAALKFGIEGKKISHFLHQIGIEYPDPPPWVPAWAKPSKPPSIKTQEHTPIPKYLGPIPEYSPMSPLEEHTLIAETRCGDPTRETKAEEKLLIANLRLVTSLARRHQHGIPLEDLISEGTLGLRVAIKKFNPSMGARLSTYAIWWIKHHLRKALNESKTIRIPIHQQHQIKKIQDTILRLTELTGNPPSDEEVAEETGLKTHTVQNLRALNSPIISLQTQFNHDNDGRTFEETLKDNNPSGASPFEHLKSKHAKETLERILKNRLNLQEQEVIQLRFGLDGNPPKTLDETGDILKLTRERIRQIQNLALKKLKESLTAHQALKPTLAYSDNAQK